MKESAVLLITFKRTDTMKEVLHALQKAKPSKIYVFADGPRNPEEEKQCNALRKLVDESINWDCSVERNYQEKNLGCGPGPDTAIRWALSHEDRIIILEDDCVPSPAFFPYCNYILEKYLNDTRIWLVSGDNPCPEYKLEASYTFSQYGHSWGWATWRRCLSGFSTDISGWKRFKERNLMLSSLPKREADFFARMYDAALSDPKKSGHVWDIQYGFGLKSNGGLCVVPQSHLVRNIGYYGTHSETKTIHHDRPVDDDFVVQSDPEFIIADYNYDRYHFENHWWKYYHRSFMNKVLNKCRKAILKLK